MQHYKIDLDVHVIPDDHGVWKLFPGEGYSFSKNVQNEKLAFLDIRGLDTLGPDVAQWNDADALQLIAADRWRKELLRERKDGPQGSAKVGKTDRRYLTYLRGLLQEVKKGDLLVVPTGGYDKPVLIGLVLDEPGQGQFSAPLGESESRYPGRRVRWLPSKEKRLFSADLMTCSPKIMPLVG